MGILDKAKAWREKRKAAKQSKTNQRVEEKLPESAGPNYSLIKHIQQSPYSKKSPNSVDPMAREFIKEHVERANNSKILPGQLIIFEYFEPKTKEELEYYDASPCTLFFNIVKTNEGQRVLGFNIHYYPPKMRFQIMNTIFNIFKPIYTKYFKEGISSAVDAFDYKYLIDSLEKAGLGFGVRMYIPSLIKDVRVIPPQMWQVAVYTEGWFKKQTRAAIMNYWQRWVKTNSGVKKAKAKEKHKNRR